VDGKVFACRYDEALAAPVKRFGYFITSFTPS
jgi:hypothetical protein